MHSERPSTLSFEDCELDLASREFRRAGEPVALEPRVFDLLAFLIEQRERVVGKDEIQQAVWKGTIVSETALTRAIMKVRRAVGDSAERQAVIRTVHGHGYQFVADLAAGAVPRPATRPGAGRWRLSRLLAAAAGTVIVVFLVYLWPGSPSSGSVRLAVLPVENTTDDRELDWARLGLMGFTNDMLAQAAQLDVLRPSDVIRFTEIHGLPDAATAAAQLDELQRLYGANHMLASRLERNASGLRLSYVLYKPNGEVDRGTMVGSEATRLMRGMVHSIGGALGIPDGGGELEVVSDDPFINEAYSRGRSFSLEGRCTEALRLFEVVKSATAAIGRAHYEWASCARIAGRSDDAEKAFLEILEKTPAEPPSALRALAFHGLGTVYIRSGRGDAARRALLRGLDEAEAAGDLKRKGMILHNLAIEAKDRREFAAARDLLARATVAYTRADSGRLPGQLPATLANIDMAEGKLEEAEAHLEQALARFRAIGDRRNEAMMLNNMGYLLRLRGRGAAAEPLHLESLAIRREIGDRVGQGRILGMLSTLYEDAGRFDEARAAAQEAFDIARAADDRLFMATSLAQRAQAEAGAGETEAARASFVESRSILDDIGDRSRAAQVSLRLARLDFRAGQLAAAAAGAQRVLAESQRESLHEPAIEALELIGDIAGGQANAATAIAAYRDAVTYIDQTGFVGRKTDIVVKLVTALLEQGDLVASEPLVGYLIEQGNTAASLRARADYAFRTGDIERAVRNLEAVRAADASSWSEADEVRLADYRAALRR
ncbi:MAG: tetratricopeptide repeat protein [Pseudomonadota bacterium]